MFIKGKPVVFYNSEGCFTFAGVRDIDLPRDYREFEAKMRMVNMDEVYPVLLLEGGADIDPLLYGEEESRYTYSSPSSKQRDMRELAMYDIALELGWAVFGICRGHQLMAAANGGTLWQDLSLAGARGHTDGKLVIHYEPMKEFRQTWRVNSMHHQAIRRVPDNAILTASAQDGIIEAVTYIDHKAMSVQFHPEFMGDLEFVGWALNHIEELADERRSNIRYRNRNTEGSIVTGINDQHTLIA